MVRKTKKRQVHETPSERFERVMNRVLDRQRRAKMRKEGQLQRKVVTSSR